MTSRGTNQANFYERLVAAMYTTNGKCIKGNMSAIFSNILKSQNSYLYQRKPENNGSVLLKLAILVQLKQNSRFKVRECDHHRTGK